jgi:chemotaxis protein CheD
VSVSRRSAVGAQTSTLAGSAVVAAPAGAPQGWSALPPAGSLQAAYLHAGHVLVSRDPCRVTTVLGSCVAVGLWDPTTGIGGVNHFLLPERLANGDASPRFGNIAVRALIDGVTAAGARRSWLQAKLFGGACVLRAFRNGGWHLGSKNVDVARRILRDERIPVAAEDVEGTRGRKLIFQTHDGAAWVRSL